MATVPRAHRALIAVFLAVAAYPSAAAGAVRGVVLTQVEPESTMTLTVSSQGVRTNVVQERRQIMDVIVRYGDGRAFVVNHATKTFAQAPLADLIARQISTREAAIVNSGGPTDLRAKQYFPNAPQVVALRGSRLLHGIAARGFEIRRGAAGTERLWFATSLALPPRAVRDAMADLGRRSGVPLDRILASQLASTLLRTEAKQGGRFVPVLDTTAVSSQAVPAGTFQPPTGYRAVDLATMFGNRAKASAVSANVSNVLLSAVSSRRRVRPIYWGGGITASGSSGLRSSMNTAITDSLKAAYSASLGQYGVTGDFARRASRRVGSTPPAAVGADFPDSDPVSALGMLIGLQITGQAARDWVCCGATDPILAVFVDDTVVADGAWRGYHFFVPSETAVLAFPLSLMVRPGVPYELNKVPHDDVLTASASARATTTMTHEYVEAATDPFPFTGWVDLGQQPVWTRGEIADICPPFIEGEAIGTVHRFAFYWSQSDNACVGG